MTNTVIAAPLPTGGAIALSIQAAVSGNVLLERAIDGSAFSPIYSGVACAYFLDTGDGLPSPLAAASAYQYRYTDSTGVYLTDTISPACLMQYEPEPLTQTLIRLIQGMYNNMALPSGVKPVQVTHSMPLGGTIPMPLIVINLDLFRQAAVPIGQSYTNLYAILSAVSGVPVSGYAITGFANRLYRVSVLSANAPERDFYRDTLVTFFESVYQTVLQPIGVDVTHRWQVSSGQIAEDRDKMMPGFFFADVMLEFEGTLNAIINYPSYLIQTIQTTVTGQQGAFQSGP